MRITGIDRERKYRKRRYGMRLDGYGIRRVQLALLQRRSAPRASSAAGAAVRAGRPTGTA